LIFHIHSKPGYTCCINEVYRTPEQAKLYAQKGAGIRSSLHCLGLAADLNLYLNGEYLSDSEAHRKFGEFWRSIHPANRWGGDWDGDGVADPGDNDGNHYEMRR
jgi:hypothetical protein